MLAKRPKAIILSGGPSSVYADGAPPAPPGLFDAGVPVLGICYGFQLMVAGLGGTVERTGAAEYGRTVLIRGDDPPRPLLTPGGRSPQTPLIWGETFSPRPPRPPFGGTLLLAGTPAQQQVWMSHGDTCTAAPPGFAVTARTEATPVAAVENAQRQPVRRPVPPRGHAHRARPPHPGPLPRAGRMPPVLDHAEHRRGAGGADPRAGRRRPGDLRAVRRGGLRGRRGARAARHRRPSHLRVRRPWPAAQGRGRTSRAGLRGRHRRPAHGGERGRGVPFRPGRGGRARAEAEDHRPGVHPRVRARRPGDHRRGRPARRGVRVPGAGHAVPGRGGVGRRHRHREHQVAPQRRRAARRPEVPAGRAAALAVQGRGAAGRGGTRPAAARSSAASRSPAPGWRSGSSAR